MSNARASLVVGGLGMAAAMLGLVCNVQPAGANSPQSVLVADTTQTDPMVKLTDRVTAKADRGDKRGALTDVNAAIARDAKNASLYSLRAYVYGKQQDFSKQIADLTTAIKLAPKMAYYYTYERALAKNSAGDFKGAAADLTTYLGSAAVTNRQGMYALRATMYQRAGKHQQAIADFTKEIGLRTPDLPYDIANDYRARSTSYLAIGNKAAAIKDLEAAISMYEKAGSEADAERATATNELTALKK